MLDPILSARRSWWSFLGIFFALIVVILFAGGGYYQWQKESFIVATREQLGSIADLKVSQIVAWHRDTRADMEVMLRSPSMAQAQQFLANPTDEKLRRDLQRWMESEAKYRGYRRMALLDASGRVRLAVPDAGFTQFYWAKSSFWAAIQSTNVVFSDLHKGAGDQAIHMSFWIPVGPHAGQSADGALRVEIDPRRYLYPLIEHWPMPSSTAETLLVRREGGQVVYLNNLRHKPKAALDFRLPIGTRGDMPAALAVSGYVGEVDGKDYRGVPVLAQVRPVPGTPWFMVSKVDKEEVLGPLRERAWTVASVTAILMLTAALAFRLILRTRETGFLKRQLAAEREHQILAERILYLSQNANDIILLIGQDWHIVEANNRALEAYGYTLEEIRKKSIRDLRAPESNAAFEQMTESLQALKGVVFEALHRRKSGSTFPVEVSVRMLVVDHVRYYQSIIRDVTERRAAEAALKQSEERFRRAIHEAPIPVMIHSEDGQIIAVNKVWTQISGYSHEDIPTIAAWTLKAYPKSYQEIRKIISRLYDEGGPLPPGEHPILTKAGKVRVWRFSAAALGVLPDGRRAAISTAEDVTDRNAAVEALCKSEEEFRTLARVSPVGIFQANAEGAATFWNERLCNMTGMTFAEAMGEGWLQGVHPEDRARVSNEWSQGIQSADQVFRLKTQFRVVHKNGSLFWTILEAEPIVHENGCISGYVGTLTDITDLKRTEMELEGTQAILQAAMDQSQAGIAIAQPPGVTLRYINRAGLSIFGLSGLSEIAGFKMEDLVRRCSLRRLDGTPCKTEETFLGRAVLGGEKCSGEAILRVAGGEDRTVWANAAPIVDSEGRTREGILVFLDITDRKQAENALRASLREKEALLKEVHHRVKNNLQIVSSLLSLQAAQVRDSAVLNTLRETQNRVRSMALLHEALYRSPSLAQVDFAPYVNSLCTQLYRSFGAEAARIDLIKKVAGVELPLDQAIPCGLIINELISNALKYAFPGGRSGRITVSLERNAAGVALLRVSDDGVGLPKELDARDSNSLGLKLVFSLATQIRGSVELLRDNGTEFCVTFQLHQD